VVEKNTSEKERLGYASCRSTQSFSMGFTNSVLACSASLRGLKAKLMPLLGKQQDTFGTRMPAGLRLRAEAEVFESQIFSPPLYLSLTVAS